MWRGSCINRRDGGGWIVCLFFRALLYTGMALGSLGTARIIERFIYLLAFDLCSTALLYNTIRTSFDDYDSKA